MKKWIVLLLLVCVMQSVDANREVTVDLSLIWDDTSTFKGSEYVYGVELVDWDKCDAVYWDGARCVFTAGIRISQMDRGTIKWEKEYLHLKYGETEINQKFGDIILKKIIVNKIAFNQGYVNLTIVYENRYVNNENPLYEIIMEEEKEKTLYVGDAQNLYTLHLSRYKNNVFYVFYVNGEKKTEAGSSLLPGEKTDLWLNLSMGLVEINNNKILRVYAPSRFSMLEKRTLEIEERNILNVNGQDFSIKENVIAGEREYPLKENEIIVTPIGWIIYNGDSATIYAEKVEVTEYAPKLELGCEPCSVLLHEQKTMTVTVGNIGKGLGDAECSIYGMGVDYRWNGKLGYNESKEISVELAPETEYDTVHAELNGEKIELPVTVETPKPTPTKTQTPKTKNKETETQPPKEQDSRKKPLTVFTVLMSITFLAILGQKGTEKDKPQKKEPKKKKTAKKKTKITGLPKKSFRYFNKRI
ncbi:MAG: hypothetical protein U9N35_06980 [Euryarchaeota archaeon]|nr:hypothetical protein [Euryarchaeota archaeon]